MAAFVCFLHLGSVLGQVLCSLLVDVLQVLYSQINEVD